jgi:hypothetical protein
MANTTVRWYPQEANRTVRAQAQKAVEQLADNVLKEARGQLEDTGRVDTHFLWQSGYTSKPSGTSPIAPSGVYSSTKGRGASERVAATPVSVHQGAGVGFAASYALEVELRYSFLFRAIELTKGAVGRVLSGLSIK